MKRRIRFEYDREADAAYMKFGTGRVSETQEIEPGVMIDLGENGKILGVEVLSFLKRFRTIAEGPVNAGSSRKVSRTV